MAHELRQKFHTAHLGVRCFVIVSNNKEQEGFNDC